MGSMASQITSLTIVYSAVYSGADQRKNQRSASLAFLRGIHRWPVNSPHRWPVSRKMFPFDDVIMKHWRVSTCSGGLCRCILLCRICRWEIVIIARRTPGNGKECSGLFCKRFCFPNHNSLKSWANYHVNAGPHPTNIAICTDVVEVFSQFYDPIKISEVK